MTEIEATRLKLAAMEMVEGTALTWIEVLRDVHMKEGVSRALSYPRNTYELAIGIIEGKPVWRRDIYYDGNSGYKTVADEIHSKEYWSRCSWNPPKQKTGMIELSMKDIEYWSTYSSLGSFHDQSCRFYTACHKYLESLK